MSRSHRFIKGLIPTYVYQGLVMVMGIWLTPFFLRHLGQRDFGLWLVGTQLILYLTLTDFGVVALLPVHAAESTGRGEGAEDLSRVVGEALRLVLYQLPIVILIALGLWLSLPRDWRDLRGPLAVMLIGFVISFPLRLLPALLYGLQDLAFSSTMQIVGWSLTTGATVMLVLVRWNLYALATGWVMGQVALSPVFAYRLWKHFPQAIPHGLPSMAWERLKVQLGEGFWVSIAQVATILVASTDVLIIAKVLGPAAVVPYSCTGKLCSVLANQVNLLMHTAGPGLCELKAGESRRKIYEAISALTQGVLLFSGLVFCVVVLVNHWFVDWWVTAHQYGGLNLTILFLSMLVIRHWTAVTANSVFFFGHQRRISLTNLADGVVTVVTILAGVKLWGPAGALVGTIAGALLVSLPLNLSRIAEDAGVSTVRLVRAMLGAWWWRFALTGGLAVWIAAHWSPRNLFQGTATTVGAALVYALFMLPIAFRGALGTYTRPLLASLKDKYLVLRGGVRPVEAGPRS